jgi:hypothetical protein
VRMLHGALWDVDQKKGLTPHNKKALNESAISSKTHFRLT